MQCRLCLKPMQRREKRPRGLTAGEFEAQSTARVAALASSLKRCVDFTKVAGIKIRPQRFKYREYGIQN